MADANHYAEAADGLQAAAEALRACGQEEASEDKDEAQEEPFKGKTLQEASREAYVRVRAHNRRQAKSGY